MTHDTQTHTSQFSMKINLTSIKWLVFVKKQRLSSSYLCVYFPPPLSALTLMRLFQREGEMMMLSCCTSDAARAGGGNQDTPTRNSDSILLSLQTFTLYNKLIN